jgi:DNA modification methylase
MKQGKDWIGIELNEEFEKISQKRLEPTIIEKKTKEKSEEFWS